METHTKSDDSTTWKHWAIALAFLAFVAIVIPFVVEALPLLASLVVALSFAAAITLITVVLGRRAR